MFLLPFISFLFIFFFFIDIRIQLSPFSHYDFPLPYPRPPPTLNPHPPPRLCAWVPHSCSCTSLSLLSHAISLSPPLWLLSVHHQFQCVWLYFACQVVLLIRFHLEVRSYGICLSCWLTSLSIILSSSIHVTVKGRSSFFLSAS